MQIKYDKQLKDILKAAGYADNQIRNLEVKDTMQANKILKGVEPEKELLESSKFSEGGLTRLGSNSDH